jgi:CHAD domain-containing protein
VAAVVWKRFRRSVKKNRRAFLDGEPDGLHDFRVALRRLATIADSAGRGRLARDARRVAGRFSPLRQLEVDRLQLRSLVEDGLLSASAATTIDERLRLEIARRRKKAERTLAGSRVRGLVRRLRKTRAEPDAKLKRRLRKATIRPLGLPAGPLDDETLHKLRLRVKRMRYRLETRRALGENGLDATIAGLRKRQDLLGEFNDLLLFSRDLRRLRRAAAAEGVVTQVTNIDAALDLLRPRTAAARQAAVSSLPSRGPAEAISAPFSR